ncbi:MAG: sigma 54-interacting transcriptional regulator [Polyangiaceae bacterium]
MDTLGSTQSSGVTPRSTSGHATLCLSFSAQRPLDAVTRYALDADALVVGRGAQGTTERVTSEGRSKITLRLVDSKMSSSHARFLRSGDRWTVSDAGSKNGTFVNGRLIDSATLEDGDLLELGSTFFVFRGGDDSPPPPAEAVGANAALGIPTLHASFARDLARLDQVARSNISVMLFGETGTGKEVLARAIHRISERSGPFHGINCGALPTALVESELFGSKKGAFSGAVADRLGILRSADGGTLLLDEIGDLPLVSQAALLRVLQEREVVPVGDTRRIPVDVRVISATHRDLAELAAMGAFRDDLLARLNGFELRVPPLRDRPEDLGVLVQTLLQRMAPERAPRVVFTRLAARALHLHSWPKNVRELEKCLEAALVLSGEGAIDVAHLPKEISAGTKRASSARPSTAPLTEADEKRRSDLVRLLEQHGGNLSAVARDLGKARVQVQRWMKRYALKPEDYKRD